MKELLGYIGKGIFYAFIIGTAAIGIIGLVLAGLWLVAAASQIHVAMAIPVAFVVVGVIGGILVYIDDQLYWW